MKIQLLSDLHLESQPDFVTRPVPGADVLVLAGDIGAYPPHSALSARGEKDFGLGRFSPRHGWPTPVLYVPGNHEYDGADFDTTRARLRDLCEALDIQWLECQSHVRGGVRFVGCTLWTDFDALVPPGASPEDAERARAKAFRAANFYLQKAGTVYAGEPMLAPQVRAESLRSQAWLRDALAAPFDGPTVAVTHFAPTLASTDPRYGRVPGTAGFCSALDALLPQADVWLHGHLHCAFDYLKDGCRVVANPLGYAAKGEQAGFRPDLLIEVPGAPR